MSVDDSDSNNSDIPVLYSDEEHKHPITWDKNAASIIGSPKWVARSARSSPIHGLVRALEVGPERGRGVGNNDHLRSLLEARFGAISRDQYDVIMASVQRGVALALLPAPPAGPLALPQPAETPPEQPLALPAPSEGNPEQISGRLTRRRLQ